MDTAERQDGRAAEANVAAPGPPPPAAPDNAPAPGPAPAAAPLAALPEQEQPPNAPAPQPIADGVLRPLDPHWVPAERLSWWIFLGIAGPASLVGIGIAAISGTPGWIVLLTLALWGALMALFVWLALRHPVWTYARTRYAVSPLGLEIRRGIVWRSVINVPRSRVQHTDVEQGPIMRRYDIARLTIHTAGTENAAVHLDGLARPTALQVRDFLVSGGGGDAV